MIFLWFFSLNFFNLYLNQYPIYFSFYLESFYYITIIFLVIHLNLKSFSNSSIIVLSFVWMKFIFENKKNYFKIIFLICAALHDFFFLLFYLINLICVSISIIVYLNKKLL